MTDTMAQMLFLLGCIQNSKIGIKNDSKFLEIPAQLSMLEKFTNNVGSTSF